METKEKSDQENKPLDSIQQMVAETDNSTRPEPDLSMLTDAERCFKVYGMKPSNAKVGKAFMTSYHKPKEGTKES
jgi:hypothetical protein